ARVRMGHSGAGGSGAGRRGAGPIPRHPPIILGPRAGLTREKMGARRRPAKGGRSPGSIGRPRHLPPSAHHRYVVPPLGVHPPPPKGGTTNPRGAALLPSVQPA